MLNNLQDEFQSACRTGFSTETASIKITGDIFQALDCKSFSALIIIGMSSAFCFVDRSILLDELSTCFVLTWFQSYLCNRSESVVVSNIASDSFQLSSGVPVGSMLVPVLFTLYMKPFGQIISKFGFNYHLYADYVPIYFTFNADRATFNMFKNCLKAIEHCLSLNKLKDNKNKTQCIVCIRQASNLLRRIWQ